MTEVLYDNAPLVEVIVEVRWETVSVSTIPGGAIDPYLKPTLQELQTRMAANGFAHHETLIPNEIPRELLAYQITDRFRRTPSSWPIFQIGPGVFTVNITPPYGGWSSFTPFIQQGIELLLESFPAPSQLMKVKECRLRYIDAFTQAHTRIDHLEFLTRGLGLNLSIGHGKPSEPITTEKLTDLSASMVYNMGISNSKLHVQIGSGFSSGTPATVVTLEAISTRNSEAPESTKLLEWYESAHSDLSATFESLLSQDVKNAMGKRRDQ